MSEADIRYTLTAAADAIGPLNARLLRFVEGGPYVVSDDPALESDVLVHRNNVELASNGRIIPRPENKGQRVKWDDGEFAEERQNDFYAEIEAPPQPMGQGSARPAGTGNDRTGTGNEGADALANSGRHALFPDEASQFGLM